MRLQIRVRVGSLWRVGWPGILRLGRAVILSVGIILIPHSAVHALAVMVPSSAGPLPLRIALTMVLLRPLPATLILQNLLKALLLFGRQNRKELDLDLLPLLFFLDLIILKILRRMGIGGRHLIHHARRKDLLKLRGLIIG